MAGPCCGLRGNLDVLEGNLVPTSRKEKREHFKNFANNPKLTVDDQIIGSFKSHRTLAAVLNLQSPRADKSFRKNIARTLPPSGHLPLSNPDLQKRSIAVQQPSLKASANRRVPVQFDYANKTINKNRILKNSSDVMSDISYVSDGIAAQRWSFSQSKEMPISQAVNSYPRQTFLVPNNGRQHLTRKEKKRIEDTHTNLHIPDSGIGNGISPTVVIDRRINNTRYRHKQGNSCDDHEVNEREIDGNTCLSSFTFSSTSSSFSSQEVNSSCVLLCPNGRKLHSRSLSRESTTSKLLLDDNKHILTQNGLPTGTCTVLVRGNLSKGTEHGQVPESVAASTKEKDIQADKVNDEELVFSIHDSEVPSNEHTFVSYKMSKTEGKEMNLNNSNTTSQRQLTQNQQSLVVNAEKCETPCNKIDGSTSLNCAYTHVGRRNPRKAIFKLQKSKRRVQNSSSVGLMCGKPMDTTLHLGVGIGILYMLVASRKEVEKLSDLLEQTNSLVQEMKRQFQCEAGLSQSCSSKTGNLNMERPANQKHKAMETSQMLQDDLIFGVCNARLKPNHQNSDMIAIESISENTPMAELEAALEAELELMQLNLASESFFGDEAGTEDFSEWMSLLSINEPAGPDDRSMTKFDEDDKRLYSLHEEVQDINFAISPDVLCMRLHEVLQTKQEDQILELEAQLEATKNRLAVKERELQSWKDIFHQLIKLSHGNSGDDAEIYIINKRNGSFSADMDLAESNARVEERLETRSS